MILRSQKKLSKEVHGIPFSQISTTWNLSDTLVLMLKKEKNSLRMDTQTKLMLMERWMLLTKKEDVNNQIWFSSFLIFLLFRMKSLRSAISQFTDGLKSSDITWMNTRNHGKVMVNGDIKIKNSKRNMLPLLTLKEKLMINTKLIIKISWREKTHSNKRKLKKLRWQPSTDLQLNKFNKSRT